MASLKKTKLSINVNYKNSAPKVLHLNKNHEKIYRWSQIKIMFSFKTYSVRTLGMYIQKNSNVHFYNIKNIIFFFNRKITNIRPSISKLWYVNYHMCQNLPYLMRFQVFCLFWSKVWVKMPQKAAKNKAIETGIILSID